MNNKIKNQSGFALVVTLLLMVSVSLIGLLALMNASTETLITRNEKEQKVAFQLAEAGLNETYARVQLASSRPNYMGYTTQATYACGSTTCNFNTAWAGSTITAGAVLGGLTTGTYTMTVTYATVNSDSFGSGGTYADGTIVRFGQDFGFPSTMVPTPPVNGYLPVYKITSTGTYGNSTVNLTSYVAASSLNTRTLRAIDTNSADPVDGNGAINITSNPVALPYPCTTATADNCGHGASGYTLNTQLGDTIANIKSIADWKFNLSTGGNLADTGTGANVWGDWTSDTFSTIVYIDSGVGAAHDFSISGNQTGRGILIIDGDLRLTGTLQYEGLIYVMGTLTISGGGGGANVTGGIIAENTVSMGGSVDITYDQATLDAVARENGGSAVVRWRRE